MLYGYFEGNIAKGRHFTDADFYIDSPEDAVNVILGFNYIGVYDIGDVITLSLYAGAKTFDFHVIGFYEEGTSFPDMNMFFEPLYFDSLVVMPFFAINHEPTDEQNRQFQIKYYDQKISGFIRILEPVDLLTESQDALLEIHARYLARVNEIAERHGLRLDMSLLPVPRAVMQYQPAPEPISIAEDFDWLTDPLKIVCNERNISFLMQPMYFLTLDGIAELSYQDIDVNDVGTFPVYARITAAEAAKIAAIAIYERFDICVNGLVGYMHLIINPYVGNAWLGWILDEELTGHSHGSELFYFQVDLVSGEVIELYMNTPETPFLG